MPLPKLPELDPKKPDKDDILKSKTNVPDLEEVEDDIVELTDEDFFDVKENNLQEKSNFKEENNFQPEAYQGKFNYKEQLSEDAPPPFPETNQNDLAGEVQQQGAQERQTDNQKDIQRLSNEIKNSKKRNNPFKGLLKNKGSSKLLENKKVKYILISVAAFIGIILLMTILSKFRGNKTQDKPQVQPQVQEQESQAQVQQGEPEVKQTETLQLVKKIKDSTDNSSIIIELNKIKEPIELKYLSIYYQEDNNKVNECTLFDLNLDSKTKEVELKCDTQPIVNEFKKVQYLVELERK